MFHPHTFLQTILITSLLLSGNACTLLPSPPRQVEGNRFAVLAAQTHIVQKGDTLYGISRRYRVDMYLVARLNGLKPPYLIYPGQPLQLTENIFFPPAVSVDPPLNELDKSESSIYAVPNRVTTPRRPKKKLFPGAITLD